LEWLDRFSDDAAMTDTLGGTLESLLLGGPGMPRVQHLHAHSIGKMLLDMSLNVPADHDPDGAWRRRRLLAEMKGGKSGEYTLINIPHLGIDPAQVPDAMYFLMAEAMLFRSQALPLARRTLEYLCSRGTHTDPRPHLLHAFVNLLAGERMLAWADLITARRFSPRVSGQQADRVRKTHFRDTPGTFGLPDDSPIAIAIDRLLDGKPVEAREACVAALGELPAGERETMLELRLALGETAFPVSRPDRKLLDSLGRTMTVLEKHRPADGNWHAAMAADRLAAAVTARALEAADAASSADAGLYFAQALKLQSLRQAFGGASRIPDREASRVWAGLLQRSMPDDPAAGVLPAHLYTALDVPPLGLDDPAPFDAPWSVEFARMLAGWQHVPTDGDAPAALDPAEDPDLSTVDVRNARSAGVANEATPADDTPWLPGRPIALEKLRALLRPNDVFIEYALFPDAAFAVVIRRSGDGIVRIPLDQPLGPIARHAWACLAQPPAYPLNWDLEADCWPLRLLHAVLLGPLTGYLGNANRLIVAPHGPLHRIPFGTLHDGHGFLAEQFEIIQVPSAGAWGHLAVSPGPFPLESLAITDVDGEWGDALPGANRLVQLCPRGQQFDGVSMAADRAIEIAASAAFIHLSARGFLDADFPLFSPLFLGKGPAEARAVLMPYQLAQAPAMPVLLTVDGFASEVSREGADREAIHPCAGFHAFGASNVISTAWRSDPAVIGELFASFYDELDSNPVARAMRAAQATIRNRGETSHPYYWGAPVFSGEGNASIKNLRKSGVI
ncbi:MAG: CHAT domain-containing protein, partial [Planctomycetota bacterium]